MRRRLGQPKYLQQKWKKEQAMVKQADKAYIVGLQGHHLPSLTEPQATQPPGQESATVPNLEATQKTIKTIQAEQLYEESET